MRRGQSLVVWAIREGRQCARAVDEFLMGRHHPAAVMFIPSPPFRGEREGPNPKDWEGEVGRRRFPHLTLPSPPPRAEREKFRIIWELPPARRGSPGNPPSQERSRHVR